MSEPKLPEGPRTLPLLQKIQWFTKPLDFLETCAQRYGDIFTVRLNSGSAPRVFISNPQAIQEIFTADPKQLDSGNSEGSDPGLLGRYSLLALSGEQHRRQRKLLTPTFHGQRMLAYGQLIRDITLAVTSRWTIGEPFSVRSSMQEISFEVILKAVFGLEDSPRYEQLKERLIAILNPTRSLWRTVLFLLPSWLRNWGPWSLRRRLMRQQQAIDELIYAEIAERRLNLDPSRSDILTLMILARDEAGESMTDVELRDELITLLVAGHETTATSLAWALYCIHLRSEVREKLLQELDALGENPDPKDILQLPYLNAVCQETLRIYPVGIFALARVVKSPLQIGGYQFEPGTRLFPCIYLTHHRQELYPEPDLFKPERFESRQFSPYEYLPFGGGNRRCIGMAFAQFEMKLVLAAVLSRWQMALADSKPEQPLGGSLLLRPKDGVRMVVTGMRLQDRRLLQGVSSGLSR